MALAQAASVLKCVSCISYAFLCRCRMFGLAGHCLGTQHPACSSSAPRTASLAGCSCSTTVWKLTCNKQLIQTEALRQNKVWNTVPGVPVSDCNQRKLKGGHQLKAEAKQLFREAIFFWSEQLQKPLGGWSMLKWPGWSGAGVCFLVWGRGSGSAPVGREKNPQINPKAKAWRMGLQLTTLLCTLKTNRCSWTLCLRY